MLGGEYISKILIVMYGDKLVTKRKRKASYSNLSGTEEEHQEKINNALSMITQFNLPPNTPPEKYVYLMLNKMNDKYECVMCTKISQV